MGPSRGWVRARSGVLGPDWGCWELTGGARPRWDPGCKARAGSRVLGLGPVLGAGQVGRLWTQAGQGVLGRAGPAGHLWVLELNCPLPGPWAGLALRRQHPGNRGSGTWLPWGQGRWTSLPLGQHGPQPTRSPCRRAPQAWHHGCAAHHTWGAAVSGLQPRLLRPLLLPVQEESQSRGTHTGSPLPQVLSHAHCSFPAALHCPAQSF